MTDAEFDNLVEYHLQEIAKISMSKGTDYKTDGQDRLSNFKDNGRALGLDPMQVWAVYASKHWNAIMSRVRTGKVESESIESRFHDLILYLFLGLGLLQDPKEEKKPKSQNVSGMGNGYKFILVPNDDSLFLAGDRPTYYENIDPAEIVRPIDEEEE